MIFIIYFVKLNINYMQPQGQPSPVSREKCCVQLCFGEPLKFRVNKLSNAGAPKITGASV
jgi:hypothetical protein